MRKLAFLFVFSVFFSCSKELQTNLIQGKLKESCAGSPIADTEVILMATSDQKILASSTTDEKGDFSMSYDLDEDVKGNAELKYFNENSFKKILGSVPLSQSLKLNILKISNSEVIVGIKRVSPVVQDTLFLSIHGLEEKHALIHPQTDDSISVTVPLPNEFQEGPVVKKIYWGVGEADYQKAKKSVGTNSPFQVFEVPLRPCSSSEIILEL